MDGNIVTAELSIEATIADNGIGYKCEAKNKAITSPLSETVTFQVFCKSVKLSFYFVSHQLTKLACMHYNSSSIWHDNSKPSKETKGR